MILTNPETFDQMVSHITNPACETTIAWYGRDPVQNVAIECESCGIVLEDFEPESEVVDDE